MVTTKKITMKNKSILVCIFIFVSCFTKQGKFLKSEDVIEIDVRNRMGDNKWPKDITIDDHKSIELIVDEINNLKDTGNLNTKSTFGDLELKILLKNNSKKYYDVIYTRYNGVVIMGSESGYFDTFYKNDMLEMVLIGAISKQY
jgi:hypothetical protein